MASPYYQQQSNQGNPFQQGYGTQGFGKQGAARGDDPNGFGTQFNTPMYKGPTPIAAPKGPTNQPVAPVATKKITDFRPVDGLGGGGPKISAAQNAELMKAPVGVEVPPAPEVKAEGMSPGTASAIGQGVGSVATVAGEAITKFDPGQTKYTDGDMAKDVAVGAGVPLLTTAATFAAMGSVVPGIGTIIGAAVGVVVGGIMGWLKGKKKKKQAKSNLKSKNRVAKSERDKASRRRLNERSQNVSNTATLMYGGNQTQPTAPVGTVQGFGGYNR